MKPENFDKIKELMDQREAMLNSLKKLTNVNRPLSISVCFADTRSEILQVDACSPSELTEEHEAWIYLSELTTRLEKRIKDLDAKLLEL